MEFQIHTFVPEQLVKCLPFFRGGGVVCQGLVAVMLLGYKGLSYLSMTFSSGAGDNRGPGVIVISGFLDP